MPENGPWRWSVRVGRGVLMTFARFASHLRKCSPAFSSCLAHNALLPTAFSLQLLFWRLEEPYGLAQLGFDANTSFASRHCWKCRDFRTPYVNDHSILTISLIFYGWYSKSIGFMQVLRSEVRTSHHLPIASLAFPRSCRGARLRLTRMPPMQSIDDFSFFICVGSCLLHYLGRYLTISRCYSTGTLAVSHRAHCTCNIEGFRA